MKSKERQGNRDKERRQRKWLWTCFLVPVYILLSFILIFGMHTMSPLKFIVFLLCLGIPISVSMMWVGVSFKPRKKGTRPGFIPLLKAVLLALPFGCFPLFGSLKYREYSMEKYRTLATGVVTDTFVEYGRRGSKYYRAQVEFYCNGQLVSREWGMVPDQFQVGDSVIMEYSSDVPDFYAIVGVKN